MSRICLEQSRHNMTSENSNGQDSILDHKVGGREKTCKTLMSNDTEGKGQNLSSDNAHGTNPSAPEPQDRRKITNAENIQGEHDRAELLTRARSFLASPQVAYQDLSAKHKFLAEKGLSDTEIDALLREAVS